MSVPLSNSYLSSSFFRAKPNDVPCDKCWLTNCHQHSQAHRRLPHTHRTHPNISGQQLVTLPALSPCLEADMGSRCDFSAWRALKKKTKASRLSGWSGKASAGLHPLLYRNIEQIYICLAWPWSHFYSSTEYTEQVASHYPRNASPIPSVHPRFPFRWCAPTIQPPEETQ